VTKPIVVLSHCLANEACRYNGQALRDPIVATLRPHVTFRPVCPEVAIGLGVPRDPIHLVTKGDGVALVQPKTGLDVTDKMRGFSAGFLDALGPVDGFLLKGRSPSCGIAQVKIHAADGLRVERKGHGLFAQAVIDRHPDVAVEEEGRLGDYAIRDHFLTRIFASARFRHVRSMAGLVRFQATHKLLLLAHGQTGIRALGRIVANAEGWPFDEVRALYGDGLARALARPARMPGRINAFEHAFGFCSDSLAAKEKRHFLELLVRYRASRVPMSAVTTLLRSWAERFEIAYLADQVLFDPYPEELFSLRDSGKASER
jgi:uncharacterized protein YbgA (DUF1722 family)/uncharacterized protein YbbK (DUF523 family)